MKKLLQLQHLDRRGNNLGGLYVYADQIAAVYADKYKKECHVLLSCGKDFITAQHISEVLEMIAKTRKQRNGERQ